MNNITKPSELPLELLNQCNPEYEVERFEKRCLLYAGGDDIVAADNAAKFIPDTGYHPQAYKEKLACASYTNNFAKHINFYVSQMQTKELNVTVEDQLGMPAFYDAWLKSATLDGASYLTVLSELMTGMMTHKWVLIGCDVPIGPADNAPKSLAQGSLGDLAYVYHIPRTAMIDWSLNERGLFNWCKLKRVYPAPVGPFDSRAVMITEFKIWTMENGFAKWDIYQAKSARNTEPAGMAVHVAGGVTTFKQIPIRREEIAMSLWLGNLIGPKCADHFKMQSSLFYAQQRSLYAAPFYKKGKPSEEVFVEGGESRDQSAKAMFASRGFMTIGENDDLGFLEPSGTCYELVNTELKEMQDDIARTANQMAHSVAATTHGTSRSAASKSADNSATEIVLSELGREARQTTNRILEMVADCRGEDLRFEVRGLSDYKVTDREALIAEALTMPQLVSSVPSKEFQKIYMKQVALAILHGVDNKSEQLILKEIDDAVSNGALEAMSHEEEEDELDKEDDGEDPQADKQAREES